MNVYELFAKLSLDSKDYDKGLDDAGKKAGSVGSSIGNGLATAAKVGTAAIGAAASALGALATQSVQGFAEQEQLVGGMETLYKDASAQMIAYANDAYKTAGLSANEYMSTAIESSAAMISSLEGDTKKAAEMTNMAITDMSDNVNKMGTSMESLQNAYRGFSRGNFTMLDNLALGFAGTKEGMQQLLDKAKELSGVEYDIDSYADIVQAIHVVQDEFGITGTTAKEASSTISGSLASMKTAWDNLVVGLSSGDADLEQLINNLVDSAETAFNNIMPAVERALEGIASFVEKIAPVLSEKLPGIIGTVLPPLISAATELINGLVQALPSILQVLIDQIPMVISMIVPTVISLLPQIVELGLQILLALADGITQNLPTLVPVIVQVVLDICDILVDNIDLIIDATIQLMEGLTEGMIMALPDIIARVPEIIAKLAAAFVEGGVKLLEAGVQMTATMFAAILAEIAGWDVFQAIGNKVSEAGNAISSKWEGIKAAMSDTSGIESAFGSVQDWLSPVIGAFDSIKEIPGKIKGYFSDVWDEITLSFDEGGGGLSGVIEVAFDMVANAVRSALDMIGEIFNVDMTAIKDKFIGIWFGLRNQVVDVVYNIQEGIVKAWGTIVEIVSPLLDAIKYLVETIFMAIQVIVERIHDAIAEKISEVWNSIVEIVSPILETIKEAISSAWDAITEAVTSAVTAVRDKIEEIWNAIVAFLTPILDGLKELFTNAWNAITDFISETVETIKTDVTEGFNALVSLIEEPLNKVLEVVEEIFNSIKETVTDLVSDAWNWGADLVKNIIDGIKSKIGELSDTIRGIADRIRDYIGFSEPEEGPLSNFHTYAPDMMQLFAKGIADNEDMLRRQVESSFNFSKAVTMPVGGSTRSLATDGGGNSQTVILQIDRTELGRVVYNLNNEETRRIGVKLAGGVV